MSISFAALIAAQVSFMRMFGLGLTLAVLVDATLVRMVLVPAFMHILGRLELVGAQAAGAPAREDRYQRVRRRPTARPHSGHAADGDLGVGSWLGDTCP